MMRPAKIVFSGTTGQLLNYCADIRGIKITRTNVGRYTVQFFTPCHLDESKVVFPIIHVTCQSPSGTATVTNVLNPAALYINQSQDGYIYQISFNIEVQNTTITLPNVLLTLLGFSIVQFVDRPQVMVTVEMSELYG